MPKTPSHAMTLYWEIWFLVMTTAFLIPELTALWSGHPENTLSDNVWRAEKALPGQSIFHWTFFHFALTGMLILLFIWLIGHLGWRIWT